MSGLQGLHGFDEENIRKEWRQVLQQVVPGAIWIQHVFGLLPNQELHFVYAGVILCVMLPVVLPLRDLDEDTILVLLLVKLL